MFHVFISYISRIYKSCFTCWVLSTKSMSHLTHIYEYVYMCVYVQSWDDSYTRVTWLQHTATHCNTLQHTTTHVQSWDDSYTRVTWLQHTATHRNTLQHTTTHVQSWDDSYTRVTWLQHTATHCNTLQHTTTHVQSWDDSYTRVPWLTETHVTCPLRIHRWESWMNCAGVATLIYTYVTRPTNIEYTWHDLLICVTWLTDTTHRYV